MPLATNDIRSILEGGGLVKFLSSVPAGTALISTGTGDPVVEPNFAKLKMAVSRGSNEIVMTRVANDATDSNAVNISTVDIMATTGTITTPGYIYTGDFSGCVFYLYKSGNQITGVHAYSGSQPVYNKPLFGKRKVINQVVREFGPQDYYTRQGSMMVCRYPTRGELDISQESSLSFLSCVEATTATTFLFSVSGSPTGSRVKRFLRAYHVKF